MMLLPYRPNVCLLIMNNKSLLFLGERADRSQIWQLPQGGVESDASIEENVIREAHEELGVGIELLEIVKKLEATHVYDFAKTPDYAIGKWRGQSQTFWLLRFLGKDTDINLARYHPEFANFCWCNADEVRKKAEAKRLPGYEPALKEYEQFLKSRN
jgi:putative (di)nucleoside polyphosphate hydrolase